jgi:cell fate regulator YaaT (PSP1 superfamily)
MGEVSRFAADDVACSVGSAVVVRSPRGEEVGTVVGRASAQDIDAERAAVLRAANDDDLRRQAERHSECESEFPKWQEHIRQWQVDVELIDLEKTLDGEKLVLYVLNDRGPETTKLALRAAAAGYGVIEVQPVGREGLIQVASGGGGCGTCGHKK